jgi:hypothetical protein
MVGMLSNRIWTMPTATRSEAPDTATIYFRCGSQQGKPVRAVDSGIDQGEFDRMTVEFLEREIAIYRTAAASRQKNAARNLKKYLDADDVRKVEADDSPGADIAFQLL